VVANHVLHRTRAGTTRGLHRPGRGITCRCRR
jgi:hypothetical protein